MNHDSVFSRTFQPGTRRRNLFVCEGFITGHCLVWWLRVKDRVGVRVWVMVCKLLGLNYNPTLDLNLPQP